MRAFSALLLAGALATSVAAQQAPATAIKLNPAIIKTLPPPMVAQPAKPLADLLATCPACQTIATPTGTFQMKPGAGGQMVIMQTKGNPFGAAACPAGLDAAQTTAMKARLASLIGAPTVKLLEQGAARESCPNVALAISFAQIVLGDDISIAKKP
ncbi:hypothetical protein [Sandarakinorhabdus sp. AAP62]|uniref:hypothetical protein n=1 Tax=Sandarakinorhabdus sp. AAP62 TaxID=1248916 RepID=UPI0002F92EBD|nr:hypothetical protein [Sandarakinorhabdus sp. AAP62]